MTTGDHAEQPDHDNDAERTEDAWHRVTSDFAELGARVRTFFADRDGDPSAATTAQESIQELVAAAERAGRNIGAAFRDEAVQAQAKSAMTSLIEAIGTSARELTDRISSSRDDADST